MDSQRRGYPLPEMCVVLDVSASGYRAWYSGGTPGSTCLSDVRAVVLIKAIHAQVRGAYGSRRMHRALQGDGHRVGLSRVERPMRDNGVRARHKRRYKATTDSKHALPVAANLLDRQFSAKARDQVWTGDITYIPTDEGWRYLAIVLDLFNREVIGGSIQPQRARAGHSLSNPRGSCRRSVPVHRSVLQPESPPLHAELLLANSVSARLDQ